MRVGARERVRESGVRERKRVRVGAREGLEWGRRG